MLYEQVSSVKSSVQIYIHQFNLHIKHYSNGRYSYLLKRPGKVLNIFQNMKIILHVTEVILAFPESSKQCPAAEPRAGPPALQEETLQKVL